MVGGARVHKREDTTKESLCLIAKTYLLKATVPLLNIKFMIVAVM